MLRQLPSSLPFPSRSSLFSHLYFYVFPFCCFVVVVLFVFVVVGVAGWLVVVVLLFVSAFFFFFSGGGGGGGGDYIFVCFSGWGWGRGAKSSLKLIYVDDDDKLLLERPISLGRKRFTISPGQRRRRR